ncbi:MAG: DNA repair exonuclease [Candidatus Zixiibacteriota bacterium]
MSEPLRFIHCADLHLDCPLGGLTELPDSLAQKARKATFSAFGKLIDEAIARAVDFVVIAGDIFNSKDKSLRAQLKFRDGMARLDEAGIEVFIVHGNHDPLDGWAAEIAMPPNVHRFGGDVVECVPFLRNGNEAARVYGISYPHQAVHDNLAAQFVLDNKNVPAIAVLHCLVGGTTGHERYAPTTKEELLASGFDYWALGHVHTKAVINDNHPAVVYPGNIQGLHRNEIGERGCYLVEMDESRGCRLEFISLDCLRYEHVTVDISDVSDLADVIENILVACRERISAVDSIVTVELAGRSILNRQLRRDSYMSVLLEQLREKLDAGNPLIRIESLRVRTVSVHDIDTLRGREDFIGGVLAVFDSLDDFASEGRQEFLSTLQETFSGWDGAAYVLMPDDDELPRLLDEARQRIIDELLEESGDAD